MSSCSIAGEVALRLAEQRLVLGQLPLRLRQRRLVGARIDLGEEVAGVDHLALGEPDLLQVAGDLGLDGHGLERRHRSQGVDGQRHVAERHRRDAHGLRRLPGRPEFCPSLVDGAMFSNFCQAKTAAAANATTIAILTHKLRRRGRGASTIAGAGVARRRRA